MRTGGRGVRASSAASLSGSAPGTPPNSRAEVAAAKLALASHTHSSAQRGHGGAAGRAAAAGTAPGGPEGGPPAGPRAAVNAAKAALAAYSADSSGPVGQAAVEAARAALEVGAVGICHLALRVIPLDCHYPQLE